MVGIYKITSPSGKVYIGQSWDIKRRLRDHSYCLKGRKSLINSSFIKYGFDKHSVSVIHELPEDVDQSTMDDFEIFYINQYLLLGFSMLNLRSGGMGGKVYPEAKLKMSIAKKGKPGKPHTEEMKRQISASVTLQHQRMSEEKKQLRSQRLSISNSGKKFNRTLNKEAIRKLLEGQKRYLAANPFYSLSGKLTKEDVLDIRNTPIVKKYGHFRLLAKKYGVSRGTICDIISRRTFKNIA